jgi:hypothetical protein
MPQDMLAHIGSTTSAKNGTLEQNSHLVFFRGGPAASLKVLHRHLTQAPPQPIKESYRCLARREQIRKTFGGTQGFTILVYPAAEHRRVAGEKLLLIRRGDQG